MPRQKMNKNNSTYNTCTYIIPIFSSNNRCLGKVVAKKTCTQNLLSTRKTKIIHKVNSVKHKTQSKLSQTLEMMEALIINYVTPQKLQSCLNVTKYSGRT